MDGASRRGGGGRRSATRVPGAELQMKFGFWLEALQNGTCRTVTWPHASSFPTNLH
jgi:hypothetical protein